MIYELAQLAVHNLLRARARLAMTAGGVVVGTSAVILLVALTIGLQTAAEAGFGSDATLTQIDVWQNWSPDPTVNSPQLDIESVNAMWRIPGVKAVIPTVYVSAEVNADKYVGYPQIIGIDPRILPYMNITLQEGELSFEDGAVIMGAFADENFWDPTYTGDEWNPITVDLMSGKANFKFSQYAETVVEKKVPIKVSGVIAEGSNYDYAILMPIQDAVNYAAFVNNTEFDPKTFHYDSVTVYAVDRETTQEVSEAIRELGFATGGIGDFLNQINGFFRTMRLMLGGMGGVALLVAAFGVANTMTMAILERTKEIGLMKAIGATDQDVLSVFLIEAGLVGLVGGLFGVGVSYTLQRLINRAVENLPPNENGIIFLPFDPAQINGNLIIIPNNLALFAILLATSVGLIAGIFPAFRAAHLPPVIALKQE